MKVRVRFGVRLSWPITNAATFVFYTTPEVFQKLKDGTFALKGYLEMAGRQDIADRLVCERSN